MDAVPAKLLCWETAGSDVCEAILAAPSRLKIVLKIKDDVFFFQRWLEHHLRIVPPESLVVFDHGSTNEALLRAYGAAPDGITFVRYGGFHNSIHAPDKFRPLYTALLQSCDYAVFLDVDEFLYWTDGTVAHAKPMLVQMLAAAPPSCLFPGLWLQNRDASLDEFHLADRADRVEHGIRWGKPIIPMKGVALKGFINHTIQLLQDNAFSQIAGGVLVFHASRYNAEQRIAANNRKIVAKSYLGPGEDWRNGFSSERYAKADPHVRAYLHEIRRLVADGPFVYSPSVRELDGSVRISPDDGRLEASAATLGLLRRAIRAPENWLPPETIVQGRTYGSVSNAR